ncbi:MAG: M24 family metallopeptidase, partial [Rhizobiaceae bacterium]
LDTGVVWDGYFCDFDRNYAIGPATPAVADAHARLIDATQAAFDAARPGKTTADLFHSMDAVLTGGTSDTEPGRLGHGLGMQLTEWPSILPQDQTVLEEGMVLTLEPGIALEHDKIMVHEENIVIAQTGAEFLSSPAGREIVVLE